MNDWNRILTAEARKLDTSALVRLVADPETTENARRILAHELSLRLESLEQPA